MTDAKSTMQFKHTSLAKAVRAKCLDCGGSNKYVQFCPCDGVNSTYCPLWPFRFGKRPKTILRGPRGYLLDPQNIPDSLVELEKCRSPRKRREKQGVLTIGPEKGPGVGGGGPFLKTPRKSGVRERPAKD